MLTVTLPRLQWGQINWCNWRGHPGHAGQLISESCEIILWSFHLIAVRRQYDKRWSLTGEGSMTTPHVSDMFQPCYFRTALPRNTRAGHPPLRHLHTLERNEKALREQFKMELLCEKSGEGLSLNSVWGGKGRWNLTKIPSDSSHLVEMLETLIVSVSAVEKFSTRFPAM